MAQVNPMHPNAPSSAEQRARDAQNRAQGAANTYRDKQRAANAARANAKGVKGNSPYSVSLRNSYNAEYRDNQREANRWGAHAEKLGLNIGGYKGKGKGGKGQQISAPNSVPSAPNVSGGNSSGGGGGSTGGGGGGGGGGGRTPAPKVPVKPSFDRDLKNAKRGNTVLRKAIMTYGDTRKPDNGEMIQGGAADPKNVKLTGQEWKDFKTKFLANHKSAKNLSERSLRVMARYMKHKGQGSAYGLTSAAPPAETPPAEG